MVSHMRSDGGWTARQRVTQEAYARESERFIPGIQGVHAATVGVDEPAR